MCVPVELDGTTVYRSPPHPVRGIFAANSVMGLYAREVLRRMPSFSAPIERDEFVMLYDGSKRKRYEAAARGLVDRELEAKDWWINVFIKDETICSWTKVDPAPRIISPRSPEYCLELGRFIKPDRKSVV